MILRVQFDVEVDEGAWPAHQGRPVDEEFEGPVLALIEGVQSSGLLAIVSPAVEAERIDR